MAPKNDLKKNDLKNDLKNELRKWPQKRPQSDPDVENSVDCCVVLPKLKIRLIVVLHSQRQEKACKTVLHQQTPAKLQCASKSMQNHSVLVLCHQDWDALAEKSQQKLATLANLAKASFCQLSMPAKLENASKASKCQQMLANTSQCQQRLVGAGKASKSKWSQQKQVNLAKASEPGKSKWA